MARIIAALSTLGVSSAARGQYVPGNADGDFDLDLRDVATFQRCFTGPAGMVAIDCSASDVNASGHVDLADLAYIRCALGGPDFAYPPVSYNRPASPTIASAITVYGWTAGGASVRVSGPGVDMTLPVSQCSFEIEDPPLQLQPNLVNNFYLTAIYPNGSTSAPVPLTITHDQQMPSLFIDFPPDGAELTNEAIVVAGRVGDMLSGFNGLEVEVDNDDPAIAAIAANVNIGVGTNGTYESQQAVPLNLGLNIIKATATDVLGNATVKQITVTRVAIPEGSPQMMAIAGNDQSGQMLTILPEKLVVQVLKSDGSPFVNKVVTFNVTQSNGRLYGDTDPDIGGAGSMMLQVHTDTNGKARALWRLGTDAGCGNNRVTVTSTSIAGTVFFCASASAAPPSQINIGSGNNQRTEVGGAALEPLRVRVSDGCNGVPNVPVTFTVVQGNGKVSPVGAGGGSSSVTVPTGPTGHAAVDFVLGTQPGNNAVEATWGNNPGMPARFVAYGVQRDLTQPTRFTGLVLDNASQPLGHAHVKLTVGTTIVAEDFSETDGRFELNDVSISGPAELRVEGYEVNTVGGETVCNGSYPFLRYAVVVTPNADNSLPSPVLLPKLDPCNQVTYDGTQDVELIVRMSDPDQMPAAPCDPPICIPGIEGLKMTLNAGTTVTLLDGTIVGPGHPGSVTLSLNQVHHDDVPMPMPDGAAPPFAWTLQPGGATFDPPLAITYPNMSGLSAGSVAYFLSFNHDTGKFEVIATGHVMPDGSAIETDPGDGLSIAGWGCNCPPYSVTGDCCVAGDAEAGGDACEFSCVAQQHPSQLYGFDDHTDPDLPKKSVKLAGSDLCVIKFTPEGQAPPASAAFNVMPDGVVSLSPTAPNSAEVNLTVGGLSGGVANMTVELGGNASEPEPCLEISVYPELHKTVGLVVVHELNDDIQVTPPQQAGVVCVMPGPNECNDTPPGGDDQIGAFFFVFPGPNGVCETLVTPLTYLSSSIDIAHAHNVLNSVYAQAVVSWSVVQLPDQFVDFDLDCDGMIDVGSGWLFPFSNEQNVIIDTIGNPDGQDFMIYLVDRPDTGDRGHMPLGQQYGFIFVDVNVFSDPALIMAHELGHGQGLCHVDEPALICGSQYQDPADTTNLMHSEVYPNSTRLRKEQWDDLQD